jgi:hypothetical protein
MRLKRLRRFDVDKDKENGPTAKGVAVQGADGSATGASVKHRTWVVWGDEGHYAACSCGWRESFHFLLAARREAKQHCRYGGPNPRLRALIDGLSDSAEPETAA